MDRTFQFSPLSGGEGEKETEREVEEIIGYTKHEEEL